MKCQKCGNARVPEPIITGTLRVTDPPRGRAKDHCIVDDAGFNDPDATPETDKYYGVSPCGPGEVGTDDVEFARKLECARNKWKRKANITDMTLSLTTERDRLLKANADVVAHPRALLDQVTALRAERDNLWQHRDAMQGALKTLAAERDQLRASNQELKEILVLLTRAIHDENWKEIANLVPRMEAAFAAPEAALTKGNRP